MDAPECSKTMNCAVFEDNNGAIELDKIPKMRPRKKYIAIKNHHFREFVLNGDATIEKVDAAEQEANFLMKPLFEQLFLYLR